MRTRALASAALVALALAGCGGSGAGDPVEPSGARREDRDVAAADTNDRKKVARKKSAPQPTKRRTVDPRQGGFEIALGEWAVTPEATAVRPGEVTFVIHNRGTMAHGFEIELEGDSSGSGSGDLFKAESELLQPGESTRMTVDLQMTGIYKIECLVDGHDDMGMEGPLEVRADAPLVKTKPQASARSGDGAGSVSISNFAFEPSTLEVDAGTEVTWTNDDPAPHTATSLDGHFDSDILDGGGSFSFRFEKAGIYRYRCNVHPDMEGTVQVR